MSDPRDKYVDEPMGASVRGDMTAIYAMMAGFANAFADKPKCFVRCEHGGACSELEGHDGRHDADGYCQWGDDDE